MKILNRLTTLSLVFALAVFGLGFAVTGAEARAQRTTRAYRVSDRQVENLLRRIESRSDSFRASLDRALDRSRFDGTNSEDNVNAFVAEFEQAADALRSRFDGRTSVGGDVENVLVRAARIDDFMRRNLRREAVAQRDWSRLRADLNRLAGYYNLAFNLDNRRYMPALPSTGVVTSADARWTGTYSLNLAQSEDVRAVADRATRGLDSRQRDRVYVRLVNRLQAPDMLALERQGVRVTLASTLAPRVTLDVDNREHVERYPNGRTARVRASFEGDRLVVVSNGDRANDFTATFAPTSDGRYLTVTRRVYAERLSQPIEVRSYYNRTSEAAQLDLYNANDARTINSGATNFVVPDGTMLVATLDTNLSTRTAREGERFTMTVRAPSQYAGAVVEGYVSDVDRAGRVTGRSEMTLNYETIRLRDGRTYRFAGLTESVSAAGEDVRVEREGAVGEDDSQTRRTVERSAIGAGIGALIGAIAGGGEGAAIGAAVGAGAGAGSVYVQGRDNLELRSGTEVTIRASAPRSNGFARTMR